MRSGPKAVRRFKGVFEELEPRLLFSAEAAGLMPLDPGFAAQPQAWVQMARAPAAPVAPTYAQQQLAPQLVPQVHRQEIIFVDAGVEGAQRLVDDIVARQTAPGALEIHWLDSQRDGLAQISEVLQNRQDIAAIHLISHGEDGRIQLGRTTLDQASLASRFGEVAGWSNALGSDADILIYGCDVAESANGQAFVNDLALLTGADVAASTDLTGARSLGGDWDLEFSTGQVETLVAPDAATQADWQGLLAATSAGSETLVNPTTGAYTTTGRNVVVGSAGNYTVMWQTSGGIYAQRYTSAGVASGGLITVTTGASLANAQIELNGSDGGLAFVWNDATSVYFKTYNSDGTVDVATTTVASGSSGGGTTTTYSQPTVARELGGDFVVAYKKTVVTSGTTTDQIVFKAYTNAGALQGTNGSGNISSAVQGNTAPSISLNSAGGFVVSWTDSTGKILASGYNSSRVLGTSQLDVTGGAGGSQSSVSMDYGTSDTVVAYVNGGNIYYSYYTFSSGTLTAVSTAVQANQDPAGTSPSDLRSAPAVRFDNGDHKFLIAWQNSGQDGSGDGVFMRLFYSTPTGASAGPDVQVNTSTTNNQQAPSLAFYNGKAMVVWSGNGTQAGQSDSQGVFFQRNTITDKTAPTLSAPASASVVENMPTAVTGISITDADSAPDDTLTLTVGSGTLTATSGSNVTVSGSGTATLVLTGSATNINSFISASGVKFRTAQDSLSSVTLTSSAYNPNTTLTSSSGSTTLNVSAQHAPTITSGATVNLTATSKDTTSSATLVSSILTSASLADSDSGALSGIAVTSVSGSGNWQYSTDNVTWNNFSTGITSTNALLLDAGTYVRYVPNSSTSETATFAFKAWDQTSASAASTNSTRSYASTASSGGATAFSTNNATASISVTYLSVSGAETTVNSTTTGSQTTTTQRQVGVDSAGDYVTVWLDGTTVKGRVLNSSGANVISEFTVATSSSAPQVAMNSSGQFVVVWNDGTGISAQRYNANGTASGSAITVTSDSTSSNCAISMNDNGNFVIGWTEHYVNTGSNYYLDVYAQDYSWTSTVGSRITVAGGAVGDNYTNNSTSETLGLSVAMNSTGNFVVVTDHGQNAYNFSGGQVTDIYMWTYDATAAAHTGKTKVNSLATAGSRVSPSVAMDDSGNIVVTWSYTSSTNSTDASATDVYTRRGSYSTGTMSGSDAKVNSATDSTNQNRASIGMDTVSGRYVIAYQDSAGSNDIYLREYNNAGTAPTTEYRVNTTTAGSQSVPSVAYKGNHATVVWTDPANSNDIKSQRYAVPNTAPVYSSVSNFTTITEDQTNNSGQLVSTLFSSTDADSGAVNGIALYSQTPSNGTWQYSTDGGGSWTAVGSVSGSSALLLRSSDYLRFVPDGSNADSASLGLYVWDQTSGSAGSKVDASTRGGTTAFSSTGGSSAITVTAVNDSPVITSNGGGTSASISVAENSTAVTTVTASDVDTGATQTYTISGGADAAKFSINSSTGVLTFASAPNYESPTDSGGNNVYDVIVQVSDGSLTDTQAIAVTVTNVNEAPTVSSGGTASVAENSTSVMTVTGSDPDAGATLSYSIVGGADQAKFTINSATGVLTFASAPNFESPADSGADNVYDVTVQVSDGSLSATKAVAVTVTNVNEAPTVTSGATASVAENSTAVMTVTGTDPDAGTTLSYSIVGGADQAKFTINSATGALSFSSAPNYESPTDSGGNNVYDVTVQVSDGSLTATKAVAVTVTNVNEAPTVTSGATASVAENSTAVMTVTGSDPDAGATLSYSIVGGADQAKFTINGATGALTFASAPNYESPNDSGADNVYDVTVQVSDGSLTATKAVAVTVTNVNEAPTVTSGATVSVAENATAVMTVTGSDPDAGATLSYSITGGADQGKFTINSSTGALTFISPPNYESPTDSGGDNIYDVTVQVSDGSLTATKAVSVTVTNVNEAPSVTSGATASVAENATAVMTVTGSDPDAGATLSYSITGGADQAKFSINSSTGVLTFVTPPNYESPTDSGANNVYDVTVQVSDGTLTATKAVAVTVTNVNEAPTVSSGATASVAENATAVMTVTGSDPDAGATLSYSITGGADQAKFSINSSTGALTFISPPNYESPTDSGANNVYDVTVQVSDGSLTATKAVAVTVTDVNEAPTVTSGATASVAENATAVMTVTGSDPDAGATLSYSITGGADQAKFTIDSTTGALSFLVAPDYESPTDSGANNVYDVTVQVSDGSLTATKAVAVTVTALNDNTPSITSGATASVAENTTAVMTVTALDADLPGQTLVYSIVGGADQARFTINGATGALSFASAQDFESPLDAGGDNVYDVTVQVSDGSLTASQAIAVTVTNANESPAVTSAATASVAENTTLVMTVTASDPDAGATLSYSIAGGADQATFTIDSSTGVLSFVAPPDRENPTDVGANNIYDIVVQVSDGSLTATRAVAVTVTDVNEAPSITSGASASVLENTTAVMTVSASDPDAGATQTYSIVGGADAAQFTIDANTGALSFLVAPMYAAPTDSDGDNAYEVTVQVSDGALTDTKAVTAFVTNVNSAPTITSGATASVAENATAVMTVTATDPDPGTSLVYSIVGGADAAKFSINAATGALRFVSAPDLENPTDAGTDNVYDVVVQTSDGSLTDTQAIAVTVTNVNEAPTVTSGATASVAENATAVMTVTGSDIDAGTTLSYGIAGGLDAARFSIDSSTGVLSFLTGRDFESPTDSDADNVYEVTVQVSDGSLTATKAVAVTVTAVNDNTPAINSAATASVAENTTAVMTVTALDADLPSQTLSYSIVGGADQARFSIDSSTGALAFTSGHDFENPNDSNADNIYQVTVQVSDGSLTSTQAIAVTVTPVNDNTPVINSAATASVAENTTAVMTVTALDADLPGQTLNYSIVGGLDAARFSIDSSTGALSFVSGRDFESPSDSDVDNVYDVTVQVSDGSLTSSQAIAVTVTPANDNTPAITSGATASVAENATAVMTVAALDADLPGQTLSYSIVGGADQARFSIDSATGALAFTSGRDFESPLDADADNVYQVTVQVSDGSLTSTQAIAVTVTDVNEAPSVTSAATVSIAENTTVVTTVTGADPDAGATLSYSIVGGADAARFTIDASTGVLRFVTAADHEAPADSGANNVYDVTVQVSDGSLSGTRAIAVTVTNVNEAPSVTSGATASVAENTTAVMTVTGTDPDAGSTLSFSIAGGADAAWFTIDSSTGALSFTTAPNREAPADANVDNVYDVTVQVSDGALAATQSVAVTVTDVNEAPAITSAATTSVSENTTAVMTVTASDADAGSVLSYSIVGGLDAAKFSIDSNTGALAFVLPPDRESPADSNADHVYDVIIQASDGSLSDTRAIAVTVANVNEAPAVSSGATASVAENTTAVMTVAGSDADAGTVFNYSIVGGADAAWFTIDSSTGALRFTGAPDHEHPTDSGADNIYDITVQVSDGSLSDVKAIAVTVTNVNEAPTVSSGATASVAENDAVVTTVAGVDEDAGTSLSYSLVGGADQALFTINSATGVLSFASTPDHEHPTDAGADNVYDVTVQVSDGTLTDTQAMAITVTDVNEAPTVTSAATASVAENTTAVMTVTSLDTDLPGQTLSYSIVGGADQARFSIDSTTGALSFTSGRDFESPLDADADNVYQVTVQVSDGSLTSTQAIAVTVTDVDEAPAVTSAATVSIAENTPVVTTVTGADPDAGATLSYSIAGGADAARFTIDASTGVLRFVTAADHEAPADSGADNVYDVTVQVSDGSLSDTRAIAVTVSNVNEAPSVTSGATASVAENTTAVMTVTGTDPDAGSTLSYSIAGGADAAWFTIDSSTGALSFTAAPNREAPADANADNVYDVTVQVSDGVLTDEVAVAVGIIDVNEAPLLSGSNDLAAIDEDAVSHQGTLVSALIAGWHADVDQGALVGMAVIDVDDTHGTWQYTTDSGNTWLAFGALSDTAARLLSADSSTSIRFLPNADWHGSATITYRAWDLTSGTSGGTADASINGDATAFSIATASPAIVVRAINDAPVYISANDFSSITEDDTQNPGQTVGSLFNSIDADSGALQGMALHEQTGGQGRWQYSTNDGDSWSDIGPISDTSALLLRASDRLRFVPDALNADAGQVRFYAWDQTSGMAGTKADVSMRGASSAYSSATGTSSIVATAVNDAPTASAPAAWALNEAGVLVFSASNGNLITVADADAANELVAIELSVSNGTLTLSRTDHLSFTAGNGTANAWMAFTGSTADINAALDGLTYRASVQGPSLDTLTITLSDQGNAGAGGALTASATIDFSPMAAQAPIDMRPPFPPGPTDEAPSMDTPPSNDPTRPIDTAPESQDAVTIETKAIPNPVPAQAEGRLIEDVTHPAWMDEGKGLHATNKLSARPLHGRFDHSAAGHHFGEGAMSWLFDQIKPPTDVVRIAAPLLSPVTLGMHHQTSSQVHFSDELPLSERHHQVLRSMVYSTGLTLTIGAVWWSARVAGLITGLLVSTPAWRVLDPLPVLASSDEENDEDHRKDKYLEDRDIDQMFDTPPPITDDFPVIQ